MGAKEEGLKIYSGTALTIFPNDAGTITIEFIDDDGYGHLLTVDPYSVNRVCKLLKNVAKECIEADNA